MIATFAKKAQNSAYGRLGRFTVPGVPVSSNQFTMPGTTLTLNFNIRSCS